MTRLSRRATRTTGVALLALWGASFGLSYVELGRAALAVALAIALLKAALVLLVFMELLTEPLSSRLAIAAAVAMVAILVGLMAADVATRGEPPPPPGARDGTDTPSSMSLRRFE